MEEEKVKHVGQILKDYRLKKKISIEKISNKTKISIQNLTNIEEGDLDLIGGQFYQRSFIKSYANALRISETKILLLFDNTLNKSYEKSEFFQEKEVHLEKTRTPVITEKIPTIPLIVFASLGLIAFFLFNFFKDTGQYGEEIAVIEPKPEQKLSKIEENITDGIKDLKKDIPMKQTNLNRVATNLNFDDIKNYQIQNNKSVIKQIIAKEDVWIEIKDFNENILISTILKKDEFFKLPNDGSKVIISASNAGSLFLKDGNNNYTVLGSSGDILDSIQLISLITNH